MQYSTALKKQLSDNLAAFQRRPQKDTTLRRAAVAIVVAPGEAGDAAFILTRRALTLRKHAGQWALPGGSVDADETIIDAALREAREEIGLNLPVSAVLGCMDDYPTRSGFLITPVVAWASEEAEMQPNPDEVAAIHRIPLTELKREDCPSFVSIPESDRQVIRVPIGDNLIHAPTAAVLYQFREMALFGRTTRVDQYEQPVWAWR